MSNMAVLISINLCEGMDIAKRDEADWTNNAFFGENIIIVRKYLAEWD